jgi:hypothetical protein
MLIEFSHILTFSLLFIAAIFDVRSELGDVPDIFGISAVIGGIVLHAAESLVIGSFQPILFSLSAGLIFSVYAWASYWKGMWGGADALALSALGFGAPYLTLSLAGALRHSVSMFINLVLVSFVYTIVFSGVRAFRKEGFLGEFTEKLREKEKLLGLIAGLGLVLFGFFDPLKAVTAYALMIFSAFMYLFLKVVEEYAMVEKVDAEDLEGGEVLRGERIKGVSEDDLEDLEGEVEVVHGLRLMPVFPLALLLTDAGFTLINYFIFG